MVGNSFSRAAALAFAVWAWAPFAGAFVHSVVPETGACLFWPQRTISWALNEDGAPTLGFERTHRAMARSFDAWEDVDCTDISFDDRSPTPSRSVGFNQKGDNENLIVFREGDSCEREVSSSDPCWDEDSYGVGCANLYDCWAWDESAIAVTISTFRPSGELVDADIEFNAGTFFFTDVDEPRCQNRRVHVGCVATDLQNTGTHEVGHLLGLDHTPVRGATMYATAVQGETSKRRLDSDDIEGVCAIYPRGEEGSCDTQMFALENEGGCHCGSAGSAARDPILVALALWMARRFLRLPVGGAR